MEGYIRCSSGLWPLCSRMTARKNSNWLPIWKSCWALKISRYHSPSLNASLESHLSFDVVCASQPSDCMHAFTQHYCVCDRHTPTDLSKFFNYDGTNWIEVNKYNGRILSRDTRKFSKFQPYCSRMPSSPQLLPRSSASLSLRSVATWKLRCAALNYRVTITILLKTLNFYQLTTSIARRTSITDVARTMAHGCIEVDAAHWNRLAFLVCFCRSNIILIVTSWD